MRGIRKVAVDETGEMIRAESQTPAIGWMRITLLLAAVYNLAWGGLVVLAPGWTFGILGVNVESLDPMTPALWQCIGMIVGVYGIGYGVAARDPLRHWPITLVGLLGKILGPIGFVQAVFVEKTFPISFGWTILTNDLIWWVPFGMILLAAWRSRGRGT